MTDHNDNRVRPVDRDHDPRPDTTPGVRPGSRPDPAPDTAPGTRPEPRNSAELRAAIDRGEAGDKKGAPDPAAAPLGTDAEAGGAPPDRASVGRAYRQEVDERPDAPRASQGHPITAETTRQELSGNSGWGTKVGGIAIAIAVILLVIWLF
jgi:hypothetical protein